MTKIEEFREVVDAAYGVYLDAILGFGLVVRHITEEQNRRKANHPELSNREGLDAKPLTYYDRAPGSPGAVELHKRTQGEVKARNAEGGLNCQYIANMCLVTVYQYWEDHYRKQIAKALGMEKNALQSPVMGDLKQMRKSTIHNKAVAIPEIRRCKLLKWFQRGDKIVINREMFERLISELNAYLTDLREGKTRKQ